MSLLCLAALEAVDNDLAVDHVELGPFHPIVIRRLDDGELSFSEFVVENVHGNSERCANFVEVAEVSATIADAWRCESEQSKLATILSIQPG